MAMDRTYTEEANDLYNKTGAAVESTWQKKEERKNPKQLEERHRGRAMLISTRVGGDWKQIGSSSKSSLEQSALAEHR